MKKYFDIELALLVIITVMMGCEAQASIALATPDVDDMVLFEDEENSRQEVDLGKILFFDTRLSINFKQSCATCHDPEKGFSDGMVVGEGALGNKLGRNTPQIYNLGWSSIFMWDGREASLESQALGPIKSNAEMHLPIPLLLERLNAVPEYRSRFNNSYGGGSITADEVGRAIAAFERTIIVNDTPFDKYIAGDKTAMPKSAVRGLKLFSGKAGCIECHDGANLTDESFHSLGFQDGDKGRYAIVGDNSLLGAFKTPGLRNIEFSAPYMHNGSLASLEAVIEFYNRGGGEAAHVDVLLRPLDLTVREKSDLVDFLKALTQAITVTMPIIP